MSRDRPKFPYGLGYSSDLPLLQTRGMDHLITRTPAGSERKSKFEGDPRNDSDNQLAPFLGVRKRKELIGATSEETPLNTVVSDHKRRRQENLSSSSWPPSKGATCKEGCGKAEVGLGGRSSSINSKCIQSGRRHRIVSRNILEGGKARSERDDASRETEVTSVASSGGDRTIVWSGPGNASVVSSTSNEEEEGRVMRSSGHSPLLASPTNTCSKRLGVQTATDSIRRRKRERHFPGHERVKHFPEHGRVKQFPGDERERRKCSRDEGGDGEVMSRVSDSVNTSDTSVTTREKELDRIFGTRLWEASCRNTDAEGNTGTSCSLDPGSSSDEPRNSRSIPETSDNSCSKCQYDCRFGDYRSSKSHYNGIFGNYSPSKCQHEGKSTELGISSSSRERRSSSEITDLCLSSWSDSMISGIRSGLCKMYQTRTSSKEYDEDWVGTNPVGDEVLAYDGRCIADEHVSSRLEVTPQSSSPVARPADAVRISEQQYCSVKSRTAEVDTQCPSNDSYELQRNVSPTFVLSSGRLSKEQEKELGKRPTTIDDDFDEYFAQLML